MRTVTSWVVAPGKMLASERIQSGLFRRERRSPKSFCAAFSSPSAAASVFASGIKLFFVPLGVVVGDGLGEGIGVGVAFTGGVMVKVVSVPTLAVYVVV